MGKKHASQYANFGSLRNVISVLISLSLSFRLEYILLKIRHIPPKNIKRSKNNIVSYSS